MVIEGAISKIFSDKGFELVAKVLAQECKVVQLQTHLLQLHLLLDYRELSITHWVFTQLGIKGPTFTVDVESNRNPLILQVRVYLHSQLVHPLLQVFKV